MALKGLPCLLALILATPALADQKAVTGDGRSVLLRDDGRWEFLDGPAEETPRTATLTLERMENLPQGCRIGLRLYNGLTDRIDSLVLHLDVYKPGQIRFETETRGFSYINPTASQYKAVLLRGIACPEIDHVEVEVARNCHVGEITKYSLDRNACARLVEVRASEHLKILKK